MAAVRTLQNVPIMWQLQMMIVLILDQVAHQVIRIMQPTPTVSPFQHQFIIARVTQWKIVKRYHKVPVNMIKSVERQNALI